MATREMEKKEVVKNGGKDPDIAVTRPSASLGGVTQKIIKVSSTVPIWSRGHENYNWKVCDDCGEDFCYGACMMFDYESHVVRWGIDR